MFTKTSFLLYIGLIASFGAWAKAPCPTIVKDYILFIDSCPSEEADMNVVPTRRFKCEKAFHSTDVIKTYRHAGGKKKAIVYSYNYRTKNKFRYILAAYKYAIRCQIPIINFSGGGYGHSTREEHLLTQYVKQGGIVYAAAGNDGKDIDDHPFYPAAFDFVKAVGSKDCGPTNYGANILYESGCSYNKKRHGTSFATPRAVAKYEG